MPQSKPARVSVKELLKLVNRLTPEEQEQMAEEMKLQWLRRELAKAEESLDRGEGIPGEKVFAELKERYKSRKAAQ